MVDAQRTRAVHNGHRVGQRVAAGVTATLLFLALGGCVGAESPSGARPTTPAPTGPVAVAPGPASAAPAPSPPGTARVGTAPCLSAANPGQLCGSGPAVPPPLGSAIVPPAPPVASTPAATPVAPTGAPVPSPGQPATASLVVTAADNGTTLHLAVGQRFLLDLGSAVDWAVTVADQHVVGRVIGVLVIRGAQGIYVARAAGTTLLSAIGSPPCPSGGACPLFRIGFRLTIAVS